MAVEGKGAKVNVTTCMFLFYLLTKKSTQTCLCIEMEKKKKKNKNKNKGSSDKTDTENNDSLSIDDPSPRCVLEIPLTSSDSDNSSSCSSCSPDKSLSPLSTTPPNVSSLQQHGLQWNRMIDTIKKKSIRRFSVIPLLASYELTRKTCSDGNSLSCLRPLTAVKSSSLNLPGGISLTKSLSLPPTVLIPVRFCS